MQQNLNFKLFINMGQKLILTEEQRRLHDEFSCCQNWEEVEEFLKKIDNLNESINENNNIPHYDMTTEEYCKKQGLVSLEDIMERNGIK